MKKNAVRTFLLLLCAVFTACASGAYIQINYRLPGDGHRLDGQSVYVSIQDIRAEKSIFTNKAMEVYDDFTGIFSLYLHRGDHKQVAGTFDVPALFRTAIEKRLSDMGVTLVDAPRKDVPHFRILLKEFVLDLEKRTFSASISYDVELITPDNVIATRKIAGQGQRVNLLGRNDAEKILEDIFTDTINKLDILNLFQDARLLMNS